MVLDLLCTRFSYSLSSRGGLILKEVNYRSTTALHAPLPTPSGKVNVVYSNIRWIAGALSGLPVLPCELVPNKIILRRKSLLNWDFCPL